MNGISLFASAGIGEIFIKDIGITIKVANELLDDRANLYRKIHNSEMIKGDITDNQIYNRLLSKAKKFDTRFILATPPCQSFSLVGKNKNVKQMQNDKRSYLLDYVVKIIKQTNPDYVLIENVPRFLKMIYEYDNKYLTPVEYLQMSLGTNYNLKQDILNANDFNVAQNRKRAFIRIYKKNLSWNNPITSPQKPTLRQCIGHLPSIESGEKSNIEWHYGRKHTKNHIEAMKNTPTGKSAFESNNILKTKNGKTPRAFKTTYARMEWDKPCPTITMRNDAISSQRNVHAGRKNIDGTYSDARVLSIKELFLLTGLGDEFTLPINTNELLIRQVIGESVPPNLINGICKGIF